MMGLKWGYSMDDKTLNKEYIYSLFTGMSKTIQGAVIEIMKATQVDDDKMIFDNRGGVFTGDYAMGFEVGRKYGYIDGWNDCADHTHITK